MEMTLKVILDQIDDISTRISGLKSIVLRLYHQIDDNSIHSSCEEAEPNFTDFRSEVRESNSESSCSDTEQSTKSIELSEDSCSGSSDSSSDACSGHDQVSNHESYSYSD